MNYAEKNLQEWDNLYKSTSASIWGYDPVGFLPEYISFFSDKLSDRAKILDAGTGEGRNLKLISQLPGELHAVDGSTNALDKIPAEFRSGITIKQALLDKLPYPDNTFDLIFGIDIFETLPNIQEVIAEFKRVLSPNGYILCNIPNEEDEIYGIDMQHPDGDNQAWLYQNKYYYKFYTIQEVTDMFSNAGLHITETKRCVWMERAHPNFRSNDHSHVSQVYISKKITLT
jgi:ubiquinone/menaquinone biosynthesis C-methylase UbiE